MRSSIAEISAIKGAIQRTSIFDVIADGKKVGIVVAPNHKVARSHAIRGLTRKTASKEDFPDYGCISVRLFS